MQHGHISHTGCLTGTATDVTAYRHKCRTILKAFKSTEMCLILVSYSNTEGYLISLLEHITVFSLHAGSRPGTIGTNSYCQI